MKPRPEPAPILGGLVALGSTWTPPLGLSLLRALERTGPEGRLDLGCAAQHGMFVGKPGEPYEMHEGSKPATRFLLALITRLQALATVPVIDMSAYAKWL